MSRARRSDDDSTHVRRGAATPPSAFSQARVSGSPFYGPSEPEKCRGQGAATTTVRMYGEELQRRHRHFLRRASPARHFTGQASLKNVEGKAQRRRQYACTARSCNAAIGIFSGSRLQPAIFTFASLISARGRRFNSYRATGLPSVSSTVTSPQPSSRTPASILRRSPITTHTKSSGCTNFAAAPASCAGSNWRSLAE